MIPVSEPFLGEEELDNLIKAFNSGWISSKGEFITEFEERFSEYCGVEHGVAVSNGTAALHLALEALDIGKGDEVLLPTLTFISTANAVHYTGARPVFVDSHPEYWCINPEKIEEGISKRTKAILPVHLYGHPCDMGGIRKIAEEHGLVIVEDAAEAHGAEYKGKKAGSFGDISCFSFYGNKVITTGEGGMCLTDDEELTERMRILRDHGMSRERKYWHTEIGFNYRMTNLQAAIGVAQTERIEKLVERKIDIGNSYNALLKNVEGITLPPKMPWAKSVYWMYSILIENDFGRGRDGLMKELGRNEIDTRPFFYPVHEQPPYKRNEKFPVAEELSRKGINLPSSVNLTPEEIEFIITTIRGV